MQADFSLDYDVMTVERAQKLYLMARFQSEEAPTHEARRPLNVSLVIDRSGSMAGEKIDYTKQAAQFLIQHLSPRDTLSIVLYSNRIETLLAPQQVMNKDRISQVLDRVQVRGTTNLSGGWLEGCHHVLGNLAPDTLNRVILMTDGLANRGVTNPETLVHMAQQKREEGASTTTMGLGEGFNEDLLMEMSHAGGGAFYFIESPEVAPQIFHEELSGLLRLTGQNLMITVIPTEHIAGVNQLNAYPNSKQDENTVFRMGDIYGGEVKTMMIELDIPGLDTIGERQIATLRFEYDEILAGSTQHHIKEMPVMVNVAGDAFPRPLPNPEVAQSVLLLKAAKARQSAVKAADQSQYSEASQALRNVADEIEQSQIKDEKLSEEQKALREQAERLEQGAQQYDSYSRKTMSTQAFYTMTSRHDATVMLRRREFLRGLEDHKETLLDGIPAVTDQGEMQEPIVRERGVPPTHINWNGEIFSLQGDLIRIGRSSHNEVIIDAKGVSRFHGQIRRIEGKLFLEDVGSTNGTTVENTRLEKGTHELSVGDIVYLSDEKLVFYRDDPNSENPTKSYKEGQP